MMNPIGPNAAIPPSVENRIIRSCISVSRPTSRGRSTLSTEPTISALNRATPRADCQWPCTLITITAGTHTSAPPTTGSTDRTTITVPQNSAPSMPAAQNDSPPSVPWTMPMTSVPRRVARVTDTNLPSTCPFSSSLQRQEAGHLAQQLRAVDEQEEQRVEQDEELQDRRGRAGGRGPDRGDGEAAEVADQLAAAGEDLGPVRRDVLVERQLLEQRRQLVRVGDELLDPGRHRGGEPQRLARDQAEHEGQRHDDHEQHEEHRDHRGQPAALAEARIRAVDTADGTGRRGWPRGPSSSRTPTPSTGRRR